MEGSFGAHWDGSGTGFLVRSSPAEAVELCLSYEDGTEERFEMTAAGRGVFRLYLEGVGPGSRYGFRVHGPWDPARGVRCNPNKLLLDPYARRIDGMIRPHPSLRDHHPGEPLRLSETDSAAWTPRSVVVDSSFDWENDSPPRVPWADTVLYETHVKGMSRLHPEVPDHLRGTYAGLAHPAIVEHLLGLGVTSVELLPVHQFIHEPHLLASGRRNYWGYNPIGFFAPHGEYASTGDPVREFKQMVKTLHAAGLEVILDVVYNHTAEGNREGPTLCFRGLDNPGYYRLQPRDPSRYLNWTGTGNTLNLASEPALDLVTDSLRYWVTEMHVDGFRFDLATVLGRTRAGEFHPSGGLLEAVARDPVLSGVKLIAEPWDLGPDGYRLGGFPDGWSEWNDRYRDTVRNFWRAADGTLAEFATRITGSSDLFEDAGRLPSASINYVTCHDGFTLNDLVSYDRKHNEPNGEGNRDGTDDNRSWNSGAEGPTDDPRVNELRDRRRRSLFATLFISQGVPMMLGGDELSRTQRGNNNAYNQDDPLSWYHWTEADPDFLAFCRSIIHLRRGHPSFRRTDWLHRPAAEWFRPDGERMAVRDWHDPAAKKLVLYLDGGLVPASEGIVTDHDFLIFFNGSAQGAAFVLPERIGRPWVVAVDTSQPARTGAEVETVEVPAFGLVILQRLRT